MCALVRVHAQKQRLLQHMAKPLPPPPPHVYMHACTPIIKSRYHPYNQTEKTAEVQHFLDDDLGLDVVSLDRNWRNLGLPAEGTHCPTGFLT